MATDAPKPLKLDALGSMLEGGPPAEAPGGGTVVCQACNAEVDAKTGAPVEPVTEDNVDYLRDYVEGQTGS